MDIVLDGMASHDADMDSISFVQTEGPDVALSEDESGRSSFSAAPGKYTFELTVTDAYGAASSKEARERDVRTQHCAGYMSVYAESAE